MSDPAKLNAAYATYKNGSYWKSPNRLPKGYGLANPGEAAQIDAYIADLVAGKKPTPPALGTDTGKGLIGMIDAGFAAGVIVTPPDPPPVVVDPVPPASSAFPLPALRNPNKWISPTGTGNGSSVSAPMSFASALSGCQPGDCIGVIADKGDYMIGVNGQPSRGGSASAWVQWRGVDSAGKPMLATFKGKGGTGGGYRAFLVYNGIGNHDFRHLNFDGNGDMNAYELYQGTSQSHHVIFADCRVTSASMAGITTAPVSDYFTVVRCDIAQFGWNPNLGYGSSGISHNNQAGGWVYDQAPGFHNIFVGNRICGGIDSSPAAADGNGIILDLGGAIGKTLIGGNLIYMNGGRGIEPFNVSADVFVVNNTCFKNGLDTRKQWYELGSNGATAVHLHNNIGVGSSHSRPYWNMGTITGSKNAGYEGLPNSGFTPEFTANAKFLWVPTFTDGSPGQWKVAPNPWQLPANAFRLAADSPYAAAGIDVTALPGLDATMKQQMKDWLGVDMTGKVRPATPSLGAYQV